MNLYPNLPALEIEYPDGDGQPMTESDPTRDYLIYGVEALNLYFQHRPDVYISGNLFIYYRRGLPDAVVSPDVFVVFGVEKRKRRSYKVWEEDGQVPGFVMEITSKSTQEHDETEKPIKYAALGVLEYFQYDPTGDYLQPMLKGGRLVAGQYQPIPWQHTPEGTPFLHSTSLGLDLCLTEVGLRFYDPQSGRQLLNYAETDQARQQAELQRQQVEQALHQEQQMRVRAVSRLLDLGLDPAQVAEALGLSVEQVQRSQPSQD